MVASKPRKTPVPSKGGRPTREEARRRAIREVGVDPALVDPRRVLAGIAVDKAAPAGARVMAAKALILTSAPLPPVLQPELDDGPEDDALTRRALDILGRTGRSDRRPN